MPGRSICERYLRKREGEHNDTAPNTLSTYHRLGLTLYSSQMNVTYDIEKENRKTLHAVPNTGIGMAGQQGFFVSLIFLSILANFNNYKHNQGVKQESSCPNRCNISDFELISSSVCKPLTTSKNGQRKFGEHYTNEHTELSFPIILRPSIKSCVCLILIRSGDVATNPGPVLRKPKHPCPVCSKGVIASSKAAECSSCGQKTHIRCLPAAINKSFNILNQKLYKYTCEKCSKCEEDENHPPPPSTTNYSKNSTDTNFDTGAEQRFDNNTFQCFNRRGMHFIHLNIRSLVPKMSESKNYSRKIEGSRYWNL